MDRTIKTRLFWLVLIIPAVGVAATKIRSEVVQVKYRGEVNLAPFDCASVDRSSFIKRVCYDRSNQYMLINLSGTYYHYCEIDNGTFTALIGAESMGRFYNSTIKGRFDCRTHRIPDY